MPPHQGHARARCYVRDRDRHPDRSMDESIPVRRHGFASNAESAPSYLALAVPMRRNRAELVQAHRTCRRACPVGTCSRTEDAVCRKEQPGEFFLFVDDTIIACRDYRTISTATIEATLRDDQEDRRRRRRWPPRPVAVHDRSMPCNRSLPDRTSDEPRSRPPSPASVACEVP